MEKFEKCFVSFLPFVQGDRFSKWFPVEDKFFKYDKMWEIVAIFQDDCAFKPKLFILFYIILIIIYYFIIFYYLFIFLSTYLFIFLS